MAKGGLYQSSLKHKMQLYSYVAVSDNMLAVRLRTLLDDHPPCPMFRIDRADAMALPWFDHDDAIGSKRHQPPLHLKLCTSF
ncbi:hypothetical protein SE17_05780 [Kouleothrix aurantiaca]|uniref:Uncharacterized protein n=1 Tax=Kouleothrix aurantiaca TaxID=186479 RepID=A0A0P9FLL9_9CHLR|nr:hypothetical protein SE17_05780 [Kouleothrix aurantiaca]